MKKKHVYLAQDVDTAAQAVAAARAAGTGDEDIALIARPGIEMQQIPENYRDARTDFMPAALKGAMGGGTAGLLAGLVAMAIPGLGVTLAGAGAIAAVGAATGTWSSSLIGASLPDPVRRQFEQEIEDGRILVVLDADPEQLEALDATMADAGTRKLPFEDLSALT